METTKQLSIEFQQWLKENNLPAWCAEDLLHHTEAPCLTPVDPDGNVIHSRKMLPEERQKWAFTLNQKTA
jgi:hypothetical protein